MLPQQTHLILRSPELLLFNKVPVARAHGAQTGGEHRRGSPGRLLVGCHDPDGEDAPELQSVLLRALLGPEMSQVARREAPEPPVYPAVRISELVCAPAGGGFGAPAKPACLFVCVCAVPYPVPTPAPAHLCFSALPLLPEQMAPEAWTAGHKLGWKQLLAV